MIKIEPKKISKYWNKLEKEDLYMCPNITLFRLLSINNVKIRNKSILDIGFGEGQNIIEFYKRGGKVFGIEIRQEKVKKVIHLTKLSKKRFKTADLNIGFPIFEKKFDIIYSLDTLNYLTSKNRHLTIKSALNILKKNGYFLFHYPQAQLVQKKKFDNLDFTINNSKYKKRKTFVPKSNPVIFLTNKYIKNLISSFSKEMKLISSIFDTGNFSKKDSSSLTINRFLLFKKIN